MGTASPHKMKLSCHLESSDSVRTGPGATEAEQHANRFHAEAFSRLLFGEQIRLAQIPVLDSVAALRFLSDLIESLQQHESALEDEAKLFATPFVMCHYPGLSSDHRWDLAEEGYWKRIYPTTLANRLRTPGYRLSSMPDFVDQDLRAALGDWFCGSVETAVATPLPGDLDRALPAAAKEHLSRMLSLAGYFRDHKAAVQPNVGQHLPLLKCFESAILDNVAPTTPEIQPVLDFYRRIVNERANLIRSQVYKRIEDELQDEESVLLAKELSNSFYMWDLARCAAAGVEVTSSGIESDDSDLGKLGEMVSQWADQTKRLIVGAQESEMPFRPILQRGYFTGTESFSQPDFRKALTDGLATLLLTTNVMERRVNVLQGDRADPQAVLDYWQAIVELVSEHPQLKNLVTANVNENGILVCRFHVSAASKLDVAAVADDAFIDEEILAKTRDALEEQPASSDREGNLLDM